MTDLSAEVPTVASIEAVVHRAVPCDAHPEGYVPGCPNCLTGQQAAELGVPHKHENLGVIAGGEA